MPTKEQLQDMAEAFNEANRRFEALAMQYTEALKKVIAKIEKIAEYYGLDENYLCEEDSDNFTFREDD